MSMEVVSLFGLSESFTTRWRGQEAYSNLRPMLQPNTRIVLNLDCATALSTSFLDELLLQLKKDDKIGALVFQTSDSHTKSRLERLSGARSLVLHSLHSDGTVERIQPRSIAPFRPRRVTHKPRPEMIQSSGETTVNH